MPRACSVCTHRDRTEIDQALAANRGTFRGVARQHRLSPDAVERHAKAHLPATVALAVKAEEVTRADDLLSLLREAVGDARRLRDKAEKDGDFRCAVAAVRTMGDVVETLASIGERLARAENMKPPAPTPVLTDGELAGAIEALLGRAAARKETSDVVRPN